MLRFFAPCLLFLSSILSFFLSLSVPIIHSLYLWDVQLNAPHVSGDIRFGFWGYCLSNVNPKSLAASQCTRPAIGLRVDPILLKVLNIQHPQHVLNSTLTSILVLHPVTCILTFLAFLAAIYAALRQSRMTSCVTLLFTSLATLTATFVLVFDLIIVAVSRTSLRKATTHTLDVTWGNAVWLSLSATICLWVACAGVSTALFCGNARRQRQLSTKY